jgi:AcrR family transcriptional regulator
MTPRRKTERTAVVDAALALADREGLDSVTIRGVADEVGVAPMSLYTHFDKKEELIDFMFARLLERIFETADPLTWQEGLEAGARSARATLQAHPSWIPLLTRTAVPVSSLRPFERELKLMRKDGLTLESAMRAISSAMAFTLGFVLVERFMGAHSAVSIPTRHLSAVSTLLPTVEPKSFAQIVSAAALFPKWSFDDVFDAGLHSLIAGIEHDGARRRPPPASAPTSH